nr:MAG TPA: SCIMP protein [Caudoviricetes sp.]
MKWSTLFWWLLALLALALCILVAIYLAPVNLSPEMRWLLNPANPASPLFNH